MSVRHWLLIVGSLMVLAGLYDNGLVWWRDSLLIIGGALIGVWDSEGIRAHMRDRGVEMNPLCPPPRHSPARHPPPRKTSDTESDTPSRSCPAPNTGLDVTVTTGTYST